MSRFRDHSRREVPGLNLAALPDLIFTVLFFFMIVTHMRQVEPKVRYQVPQGSEVVKDVRKTGLVYILIGKPIDSEGRITSEETCIQLNDQLVSVEEIAARIREIRAKMPEDTQQFLTVSIRADRDTEMCIINDVKQALREAGALNISYSATQNKLRIKN